jgi:hypothetical protein
MRVEDGTNRSLDVIHGSEPEIDISSLSLTGPSLTRDQPESVTSIPGSPHRAATEWELAPTGFPQVPDTCGLTPPYVPKYSFNPLFPQVPDTCGLTPPHVPKYAFNPLSEPVFSGSVLDRWLSEDNSHERLILGLSSIQDSSSFDCEHCGKKFSRASDLTYVYISLYYVSTDCE